MAAHTTSDLYLLRRARPASRGAFAGINLQMLSPVIIGFTVPLILDSLLHPGGLDAGRITIIVVLIVMMLVASTLFALSLVWPGEVVAVIVRPRTRMVEIVRSGLLADAKVDVPFIDVAKIGQIARRDPDGYPYTQIAVCLRNGHSIAIPSDTPKELLIAARLVTGL